jgi:hypothetical protein
MTAARVARVSLALALLATATSIATPAHGGAPAEGEWTVTLDPIGPVAGEPLTVNAAGTCASGEVPPTMVDVIVRRVTTQGDFAPAIRLITETVVLDPGGTFATSIAIPTEVPHGEFSVGAICYPEIPTADETFLDDVEFVVSTPPGFDATVEPTSVIGTEPHQLHVSGAACVAPTVRAIVQWGGPNIGIPTEVGVGVAAVEVIPVSSDGAWSTTIDLPGVPEPPLDISYYPADPLYTVYLMCEYDDGELLHWAPYLGLGTPEHPGGFPVEVVFPADAPPTLPPPAPPQPDPPQLTG